MRAAAFIQFGGIGLHPAPDATGIDLHTALRQKLGNVFVGERIPQIPPHAENNHPARELAAFERIAWGERHGILRYQTLSPDFAMEPCCTVSDFESEKYRDC